DELATSIEQGTTAVVFTSPADAERGVATIQGSKVETDSGSPVAIGAVGCVGAAVPCSGYFVTYDALALRVNEVLCDVRRSRPNIVWLAGEWVDARTLHGAVPDS